MFTFCSFGCKLVGYNENILKKYILYVPLSLETWNGLTQVSICLQSQLARFTIIEGQIRAERDAKQPSLKL